MISVYSQHCLFCQEERVSVTIHRWMGAGSVWRGVQGMKGACFCSPSWVDGVVPRALQLASSEAPKLGVGCHLPEGCEQQRSLHKTKAVLPAGRHICVAPGSRCQPREAGVGTDSQAPAHTAAKPTRGGGGTLSLPEDGGQELGTPPSSGVCRAFSCLVFFSL